MIVQFTIQVFFFFFSSFNTIDNISPDSIYWAGIVPSPGQLCAGYLYRTRRTTRRGPRHSDPGILLNDNVKIHTSACSFCCCPSDWHIDPHTSTCTQTRTRRQPKIVLVVVLYVVFIYFEFDAITTHRRCRSVVGWVWIAALNSTFHRWARITVASQGSDTSQEALIDYNNHTTLWNGIEYDSRGTVTSFVSKLTRGGGWCVFGVCRSRDTTNQSPTGRHPPSVDVSNEEEPIV